MSHISREKPDTARLSGWVEAIVRDRDGNIKYHLNTLEEGEKGEEEEGDCALVIFPASQSATFYWRRNVITNVGFAAVIRLIFQGLTETKFGYLAIGTGTTAEAVTDTKLENEIARKSATTTQSTLNITGDLAIVEATFSKDDGLSGTHNVSEVGIFNAPTGGILLARKVFAPIPINWDIGDTLTMRYFINITR
jgi:hypothetical protein